MCVVRVLTLLLLAALGAATQDTCEKPTITITSKQSLKYVGTHYYEKPYGEDVIIHCSAKNNFNLSIENDGNYLQTEKFNDTTILLKVKNPKTDLYKYICKDNVTGCEDKLTLKVIPILFATSPSIRQVLDASHKRPLYFVPKGEPYEVFCIADQATTLQYYFIEGYKIKRLQLYTVNSTTAHREITADYPTERSYYCSNKLSGTEPITVVVDYYPKAEDFQCILHQSRKIDCSWTSLSKRNTFKLFYKQGEDTILLCTDNYRESNRGCTGNMPVKRYNIFSGLNVQLLCVSITLQTCNEIFCDNQTITYDSDAILKLDPASDLRLLNTTGNSAAISWGRPSGVLDLFCEFRVEYRLLATPWHQVNTTSAVDCNVIRGTCEFQLALPCSDSHYELRVSMKVKTAVEERYWSDPTSLFFFTNPNSGEADSICSAESKELEPLPSVETMLFKVRELIRFERKDEAALKKRIRALKEKLATVKELARLIEDKKSDNTIHT